MESRRHKMDGARQFERWDVMNKVWIFFSCLVNAICLLAVEARADAGATLAPEWRITRAVGAPWPHADIPRSRLLALIGRPVTFHGDAMDGPGPLHCAHTVIESTSYPADGLFQGTLPAPAATAAQELGIAHLPLAGFSLSCDSGIFEFHQVDAETMLLGLDNQILTLSHTPGSQASAESPEGRTQRFLEAHFSADMGFTADNVKSHRAGFSKSLDGAMARYFARPTPEDEVPAIDGDPFTDSQEYPSRFSVGKARVSGDQAEVAVRFSDAFSERRILYLLKREDGAWQLDNLRFSSGETLLGLLE
jgi:hypothetical protein